MSKKETNKKAKLDFNIDEVINQLKDSIEQGVSNIEKEIKNNEILEKVIVDANKPELSDLLEKVKEQIKSLKESLAKIKEHKKIITELKKECQNKEVSSAVFKLFKVLVRN